MDDQRLGIAHIGEMRGKAQRLDEFAARLAPALDSEGDHRTGALWEQALGQAIIGMLRQSGIGDPGDGRIGFQRRRHRHGIGDMALHAQRQGLDTLQQLEGVHRAHAGAEIAQALDARAGDEGLGAELLGEVDAVITGIGLASSWEISRRSSPSRSGRYPPARRRWRCHGRPAISSPNAAADRRHARRGG